MVFGNIPPGTPAANYSIDGGASTFTRQPSVQNCVPNQPFFMSSPMKPGNHTLEIVVTSASDKAPYILSFVQVCGGFPPSPPPSSSSARVSGTLASQTTAAATETKTSVRPIDGVIIGSVLGSVFALLLLVFLLWWLLRRRRQRQKRLRQLHITASPVSSWIFRQEQSRGCPSRHCSSPIISRFLPLC